jgi:hypothetical protein
MEPIWRADINSLSFQPRGHLGSCVIHQRAFGTLLGFDPAPEQCAAYFRQRTEAFELAAAAKIARAGLAPNANFHLTSRDVLRSGSGQIPH